MIAHCILIIEKELIVMKNIYVCVGSACHLKGSYDVIDGIKGWIESNHLKNEYTVKASFCLGKCTKAVSVKIEDEIYSMTPDTAVMLLNQQLNRGEQSEGA